MSEKSRLEGSVEETHSIGIGSDRTGYSKSLLPLRRLKFCVRTPIKNGVGAASEYNNPEWPRYVRITDIAGPRELRMETFSSLPPDIAKDASFKVGDILAASVGATFGKTYLHIQDIGPVSYAGYLSKISLNDDFDCRFVSYWTESDHYWSQIIRNVIQATIQNFSAAKYAELQLPVLPLLQQRDIANYLDCETARLDALMAVKERMLELLAERRQMLIVTAVAGGVKPNAPHRASGAPWLGAIPTHWKMGRLKDFGLLLAGAGFPYEFQGVDGETLPFYKVGDLATSRGDRYLEHSSNTISFETAAKLRAHVIPESAIVYAKIGAALLLNRRRITTVPCVIDNNMTAYVPNKENLTSGWAFYWTNILDFGMLANPGAVPSLSEGDQAQLPIAIPPVAEQRAIVDYLDRETAWLDELAAKTRKTVALLKERRASLISAAVTGRIDMERAA